MLYAFRLNDLKMNTWLVETRSRISAQHN